MSLPELQARLQAVRSHYRVTPWIRPRDDESPLLRSWQRCRDAGLRESDRIHFELVSRSLLSELEDRHGELVRCARPEMERLGRSLQGTGCVVLLFNPRGVVIDRLCHEASTPTLLLGASRVGMNVSERCVGTTAPSIALAEGEPYLVGREAHYCANVKPFFCVAAPIDNPRGERVAALDITAYDNVPSFDLFSLVVDAAAAIENRLFEPSPERLRVHFHARAELVGTPLEGIVEVDAEGRLTGANRAAERVLCLPRPQLLARRFRDLFDRDMQRLFDAAPQRVGLVELHTHVGLQVFARFDGGAVDMSPLPLPTARSPQRPAEPPVAAPSCPLPQAPLASLREVEWRTIETTLAALGGNVSAASRRLGISRNTIYRRMATRA